MPQINVMLIRQVKLLHNIIRFYHWLYRRGVLESAIYCWKPNVMSNVACDWLPSWLYVARDAQFKRKNVFSMFISSDVHYSGLEIKIFKFFIWCVIPSYVWPKIMFYGSSDAPA